jgi:hypothetical protein
VDNREQEKRKEPKDKALWHYLVALKFSDNTGIVW